MKTTVLILLFTLLLPGCSHKPAPLPEKARDHLARYVALRNHGKLPQAISAARSAQKAAPKNAEPLIALGEAHHLSGQRFQAGDYYRKALDISPNDPQLKRLLARLGHLRLPQKYYTPPRPQKANAPTYGFQSGQTLPVAVKVPGRGPQPALAPVKRKAAPVDLDKLYREYITAVTQLSAAIRSAASSTGSFRALGWSGTGTAKIANPKTFWQNRFFKPVEQARRKVEHNYRAYKEGKSKLSASGMRRQIYEAYIGLYSTYWKSFRFETNLRVTNDIALPYMQMKTEIEKRWQPWEAMNRRFKNCDVVKRNYIRIRVRELAQHHIYREDYHRLMGFYFRHQRAVAGKIHSLIRRARNDKAINDLRASILNSVHATPVERGFSTYSMGYLGIFPIYFGENIFCLKDLPYIPPLSPKYLDYRGNNSRLTEIPYPQLSKLENHIAALADLQWAQLSPQQQKAFISSIVNATRAHRKLISATAKLSASNPDVIGQGYADLSSGIHHLASSVNDMKPLVSDPSLKKSIADFSGAIGKTIPRFPVVQQALKTGLKSDLLASLHKLKRDIGRAGTLLNIVGKSYNGQLNQEDMNGLMDVAVTASPMMKQLPAHMFKNNIRNNIQGFNIANNGLNVVEDVLKNGHTRRNRAMAEDISRQASEWGKHYARRLFGDKIINTLQTLGDGAKGIARFTVNTYKSVRGMLGL